MVAYHRRMRDSDVRAALYGRLLEEHSASSERTIYIDELDLCGRVRVDVAVLNGSMSGYELKSASDTLRRLPNQVDYYSRVLDYAALVVAENHFERAIALIPEWWACHVASWTCDSVQLDVARVGNVNPAPEPHSVAMLLWRDEALHQLNAIGAATGKRSWSRSKLCQALASELPQAELSAVVREQLKARSGWRPAH